MKTTKWWLIITSFFKCVFPVSKIFLRFIFNSKLRIVEVALSGRHHGSWRWRSQQKIFLRPENESTLSFYATWPFGRLHTSRFSCDIGVLVWTHTFHWNFKNYVQHRCFRACSLCSQPLYWEFSFTTTHDFDLNKAYTKPQPPKDGPWVKGKEGGV
jgi:hypothetical protein